MTTERKPTIVQFFGGIAFVAFAIFGLVFLLALAAIDSAKFYTAAAYGPKTHLMWWGNLLFFLLALPMFSYALPEIWRGRKEREITKHEWTFLAVLLTAYSAVLGWHLVVFVWTYPVQTLVLGGIYLAIRAICTPDQAAKLVKSSIETLPRIVEALLDGLIGFVFMIPVWTACCFSYGLWGMGWFFTLGTVVENTIGLPYCDMDPWYAGQLVYLIYILIGVFGAYFLARPVTRIMTEYLSVALTWHEKQWAPVLDWCDQKAQQAYYWMRRQVRLANVRSIRYLRFIRDEIIAACEN